MTQRQVADAIGMQHTELCRFERGNLNVTLTTLLKITDWIGDASFDDGGEAPVRCCFHQTLVSEPVTFENQFPEYRCADCGDVVIRRA